jgi:hypothetical protein
MLVSRTAFGIVQMCLQHMAQPFTLIDAGLESLDMQHLEILPGLPQRLAGRPVDELQQGLANVRVDTGDCAPVLRSKRLVKAMAQENKALEVMRA